MQWNMLVFSETSVQGQGSLCQRDMPKVDCGPRKFLMKPLNWRNHHWNKCEWDISTLISCSQWSLDVQNSDELCLYSRYHVRNGGGVLPRRHHSRAGRISVWLLLHVTSLSEFDNEDRFLNSEITSTLNLALNLVRAFFLFFHLCPEVGGQGSERSSDAIDDPTRTWTLAARTSGNRKWIWNWFRRRFVFH